MPYYSTDPAVSDFVERLLLANARPNPFNADNIGHLIGREGVVNVVRIILGAEAAESVRLPALH
ncbi:MAG TPA: hypothetical protein VIY51_20700 [Xanthobacteraceae bacterium]